MIMIRVGWALKNTHENMYLSWLKMSTQSEDFDWESNNLYDEW